MYDLYTRPIAGILFFAKLFNETTLVLRPFAPTWSEGSGNNLFGALSTRIQEKGDVRKSKMKPSRLVASPNIYWLVPCRLQRKTATWFE